MPFENRSKYTPEQFFEAARKRHGDRFDYSESVFKGVRENFTFYDTVTKQYLTQTGRRHLQFLPRALSERVHLVGCSKEERFEHFVRNARTKHGKRFVYDIKHFTDYVGFVKFYDTKTGRKFRQRAYDHLKDLPPRLRKHTRDTSLETRYERYFNMLTRVREVYGNERFEYSIVGFRDSNKKINFFDTLTRKNYRSTIQEHLRATPQKTVYKPLYGIEDFKRSAELEAKRASFIFNRYKGEDPLKPELEDLEFFPENSRFAIDMESFFSDEDKDNVLMYDKLLEVYFRGDPYSVKRKDSYRTEAIVDERFSRI